MPSPYNLEVEYNCSECHVRADRLFCNMSPDAVAALDAVKFTGLYPKGSLLFVEGEEPRGVFILCSGRAKLTTSSTEGKTLIVKIAEPGEVLGLLGDVPQRTARSRVVQRVLSPARAATRDKLLATVIELSFLDPRLKLEGVDVHTLALGVDDAGIGATGVSEPACLAVIGHQRDGAFEPEFEFLMIRQAHLPAVRFAVPV